MGKEERIRPTSICVCRDGERILVTEYDEKSQLYYRPLGGAIELWRRGEQTVRRELREEIAVELVEVRTLGLLENLYAIERQRAHQIVLVYDAKLSDPACYQKEAIRGNDEGQPIKAVWRRLDEFGPGKPPLYPDGLLELLETGK